MRSFIVLAKNSNHLHTNYLLYVDCLSYILVRTCLPNLIKKGEGQDVRKSVNRLKSYWVTPEEREVFLRIIKLERSFKIKRNDIKMKQHY